MIVGAAEVPYARRPDLSVSTMALLADAGRRALDKAQLSPSIVDGLGVASFTLRPDQSADLAWRLGLTTSWLMDSGLGGVSGLHLLQHACRAIQAGDANTILLISGDRFQPGDFSGVADFYNSATVEHLRELPFGGPNALFALLTVRHMERTGATRHDYGRLVVAQRKWASSNPGAVYRAKLGLTEYLKAPYVAEPLTRFDCPPVVSGADALVLSNSDRRRPAVAIRSIHACHNLDNQDGSGLETGLSSLADQLWADSQFGPEDIDVVSAYDDYPAMVLVQLDELGFYDIAELPAFIQSRVSSQRLALNTSGGQLSCGQAGAAGGMHGLVEVVRQLLGDVGRRQLVDSDRGVVTGYGAITYRYGSSAAAAVLERLT